MKHKTPIYWEDISLIIKKLDDNLTLKLSTIKITYEEAIRWAIKTIGEEE